MSFARAYSYHTPRLASTHDTNRVLNSVPPLLLSPSQRNRSSAMTPSNRTRQQSSNNVNTSPLLLDADKPYYNPQQSPLSIDASTPHAAHRSVTFAPDIPSPAAAPRRRPPLLHRLAAGHTTRRLHADSGDQSGVLACVHVEL